MALQQYGCGDYIGWEMKFPCALTNVVEELQKVASRMEVDLDKWKKEIQEKRDEFYELNYYTTQQLLLLREELGRLKEPGEDQVKPHAMALLQSISREVSADVVKSYVQQVATILEQQRASSSTTGKAMKKKVQEPVSSSSQPSGQEVASAPVPSPSAAEASSALMADLLKSEGAKTSAPLAQTQEHELTDDRKTILVKRLLDLDYPLDKCLDAAERFPEDSHAYEYLQPTGEQGDIFGEEEVMEWSTVEASRPTADCEEPAVQVER